MSIPRRCSLLMVVVALATPQAVRGQALPEIRSQSAAVYPSSLAAPGNVGQVTVIVEVDELGRVVEAAVSTPCHPAVKAATERAARTLLFTSVRGGHAVGFSAIVAYTFDQRGSALARLESVFLPEQMSLIERAPAAPDFPAGPITFAMPGEQARRTPGTQGDPGKVVESLPGVGRANLGSGDLVLWGSAPGESRVLVDGIEIPMLFHLGGLRSVIPSPFVRSVEVLPGAHGVTGGRGLGGLVQVATAALPAGVHGGASLDPLDATVHLAAGAGTRWRIAGAWREGLVQRALGSRLAGEARDLVAIPAIRDQQLKATAIVSDVEEVQALFLASSDNLQRSAPSLDPSLARVEVREQDFWRAGLRYLRHAAQGRSAEAVVWLGHESSLRDLRFGATPAAMDVATSSLGARIFYREEMGEVVAVTAGLDALVSRSHLARAGSLTIPAREGDPSAFGQPPGADVNADSWRVTAIDGAPLVAAELTMGPLGVTAGARLEALGLEVSRTTPRVGATPPVGGARLQWEIDPRVSARLSLGHRVAATAAVGRYHQLPSPQDLSAVFGTPVLGPAGAYQAMLGARVQVGEQLTGEMIAFVKRLDHLPARERAATPALARVLGDQGRGGSAGLQVLLRLAPARGFAGWLAYTLSRSERQDGPGEASRLADFDQRHVLAVVAGYERGPWNVSTRFRFASGPPRTPVAGAYYDLGSGRFSPLFGPVNSTRLPPFMQLDARIERTFRTFRTLRTPGITLDVYLELLNVTARRNAEELVYSFDYSRRKAITGVPLFAVAGARLQF